MTPLVTTHRIRNVVVVEIDNPPVNALSPGVPEAIGAAVHDAERDSRVAAIVIRGAGRMFAAGADVRTLEDAAWGNADAAPDWHDLFERIENCSKPVVMAIHGAALGGGLELAMAGHYRLAASGAAIGQPEVNLGLIPGAEGTQRLPRLAGVAIALDTCISGRSIPAEEAVTAGIVDEIAGEDLTTSAVAVAERVAAAGAHVRTRDRRGRLGDATANAALFARARERAGATRRFQTAPLRVVDAIEAATTLDFSEGCRRERDLFLECLGGEQAKALIHVFLAERALKKIASPDGPVAAGRRLAARYTAESQALAANGAAIGQIDRALANFGMARGPFDGNGPATSPLDGVSGTPGQTSGRAIADDQIVERVIDALVNEGALAIEAGEVARASDVDAIAVNRLGFPGWRGGPMFYADRTGLSKVVGRLNGVQRVHGEHWRPAALLVELAASGRTFRDRDRHGGATE